MHTYIVIYLLFHHASYKFDLIVFNFILNSSIAMLGFDVKR